MFESKLHVRNVRLASLTCCNSWDGRMGHFGIATFEAEPDDDRA